MKQTRMMRIKAYLKQLGVPVSLTGFDCAARMVQSIMDGYSGKIICLYYQIDKQTGRNSERSIRHAVGKAMDQNPDFFKMLGLPETRWGTKFTNTEFLHTVAYNLKTQEELEADEDEGGAGNDQI